MTERSTKEPAKMTTTSGGGGGGDGDGGRGGTSRAVNSSSSAGRGSRGGSNRSMSSSRSNGTSDSGASGSGSTSTGGGNRNGGRSAPPRERSGAGASRGAGPPPPPPQQRSQASRGGRGGGRGRSSGRGGGGGRSAPRSTRSVSAQSGGGGPRSQRQMYQNQAKQQQQQQQQQQSERSKSAGAGTSRRDNNERNAALDRKISQSAGRSGRGGRGGGRGGRAGSGGGRGSNSNLKSKPAASSSVAQIDERIERKMDQQRKMMVSGNKSGNRRSTSSTDADRKEQMIQKKQQAAGAGKQSKSQSTGRSQSNRRRKANAKTAAAAGAGGSGGGGDDDDDDNSGGDKKPAAKDKGKGDKNNNDDDSDNDDDNDANATKKKPPKGLINKAKFLVEERDRKQAEKLWEKRKQEKEEEKRRRKEAGIESDDEDDPEMETFRIEVPDDAVAGEMFTALAGETFVRLKCPDTVSPGEILQLTVPKQKKDQGIPPDSENVRRVPGTEDAEGRWQYLVKLPEEVEAGQRIPIVIRGMQLVVTVPDAAEPGSVVKIRPPAALKKAGTGKKIKDDTMQLFEVVVPKGVKPGNPFALLAGGVRVQVQCPWNASPGMKIRFNLPKVLLQQNSEDASELTKIKNSFDTDGWSRTIRVSDMKFQWVRLDGSGAIDIKTRFDSKNSAYVRELTEREGDAATPHLMNGDLTLMAANDQNAVVDSSITDPETDEDIVSYADIAAAQIMDYEEKSGWFLDMCQRLATHWEEGHIGLAVRRPYLLHDSMVAVLSLPRNAFHKTWRFEFIGEAGLDAGGLTREWFQLVTEQLFDPDIGLWVQSEDNQMLMDINPASKWCCPEDHLKMFRFLGRVMGKAIFDGQLVSGHCIPTIYKYFLMWPCMFCDLKDADEALYNNLNKLLDIPEEQIEYLCLDFSTTEEAMGSTETVDLIPNGNETDVDADNLPEYLEANFKYRMLGRVKPQLTELTLGFLDVIPEALLAVFDFQELELLMCGLEEIDMDDWKANTEYTGELTGAGPDHQVIQWWWEIVESYDNELKARLLQFVTATSGVPSRGFGYLQGNDGNTMKFTIMGMTDKGFPRSHTCFNRIDLPLYDSKDDMEEKLKIAITMVSTGFDLE